VNTETHYLSRLIGISFLLLLPLSVTPAHATLAWEPVVVKKKDGASHGRRGPKLFQLNEATASEASLWKPTLEVNELTLSEHHGSMLYAVKSTGMDNYHALVAERETANRIDAAIRYVYMNGKPSGASPSRLTAAVKTTFEIIPAPLPREHRRYHANHDAVFVVRHEDKLLIDTTVTLTTSLGSTITSTTDRNGAVRFTLPDDFAETKPGRRANRPAEFVLSSEHQADGITYGTSYSAAYHVDPAHWKSLELGIAVLGIGFISGLVMTRRGKQAPTTKKQGKKA